MRRLLIVFAVLCFLPVTVAPAFAHARLRESSPAADGAVAATQEVSITFSEALEPKLSSIAVTDSAGHRVEQGDLHVVDGNARVIAIGLKPLVPGHYSVEWHAVSVDTHKTEGSFGFTVTK